MNRATIEEYRKLIGTVNTLSKAIEVATIEMTLEIEKHINLLEAKDKELADQLANHVAFVKDALSTRGLIEETFKNMAQRYATSQS